MTRIYVIRHGQRLDHEDRSWRKDAARPFDSPLAEKGHQQARSTAAYLQNFAIQEVYCSPLLRTIQTAHPLAEALNRPLHVEGGLSEWLNPKWHDFSDGMLPLAGLQENYPALNLAYRPLVTPRYPELEEVICQARCEFVTRQLVNQAGGDIALFTHGVCVQAIVNGLTGGEGQANDKTCAVNVLESRDSGRWELVRATTEHLTASEESVTYI